MNNLYDQSIATRSEHLYKVMSSQQFLRMQGLNNEIPFFIFPFKPEEQEEVEKMGRALLRRLELKGVHILKINLFDLSLDILKQRKIIDQFLEGEESSSKQDLLNDLKGVLDPTKYLVPEIAKRMSEKLFDILFITGVGEVYPYIRSHNLLNNLQSVAKDQPLVLWFPGEYTFSPEGRSSLKLFSRLPDNAYYRAFNILDYQV
jgi:hypothetical protein